MLVSEYYGVQFAQGQYVMHWESGELCSIVDKLFVSKDHECADQISVSYEGLGEAAGADAVKEQFEKWNDMRLCNGGLLRVDLPHTQKITISADGLTAVGEWDTMTNRIMGAAFGNDLHEAPLAYAIGHYENTYAKEDDIWKLVSIKWTEVQSFGNWKAKDATCIYNPQRPFPKPFEELNIVDDSTASLETVMTVNLRNQVVSLFSDYNKYGIDVISDEYFSEDAKREAVKMLSSNIKAGNIYGKAMVTSPIVHIEASKDRAQLYLLVGLIKPVNENSISHSRGRINAELVLENNVWKFNTFSWNRYATMEPWGIN